MVAAAGTFLLLALLAGAALLVMRSTHRWVEALGQNTHVVAFLQDETDEARAADLATLLRRLPHVAEVRIVEPAEALARLRAAALPLAGTGNKLDGLEPGYFPRSIEVRLQASVRVAVLTEELARRLRSLPGVADVDAMSEGLVQVRSWIELGNYVSWALVLAALFSGAGLLSLLVWRGRDRRRQEARVLNLLGETPMGIRLPAAMTFATAAVTGAGAGLAALAVLWGPLSRRMEQTLALAPAPVHFFRHTELAAGLATALLLGWLLGHLSTPIPDDDHAIS
jgi:cell division protein FtsX